MRFEQDSGFPPSGSGRGGTEIRLRDVTSPIDPSDHRLDSSGGAKGVSAGRKTVRWDCQ